MFLDTLSLSFNGVNGSVFTGEAVEKDLAFRALAAAALLFLVVTMVEAVAGELVDRVCFL